MPWMREGKCVFKKNADGSKGESAGCSETEALAKAHMRALYAKAETSVKNKAAGDIWAIFPLGAQSQIVEVQRQVVQDFSSQGVDFSPIDPEDFHITAVYTNGIDVLPVTEWLQWSYDSAFAVIVDGIGTFETPEGYAIYLRVRQDYVIRDMQSMLFHAMSRDNTGMVSNYSIPDNWIAHITIGYSSSGAMVPTNVSPFAVICTSIEIGDENHLPIMEVQLKGVDDMALVEKSFPIQIIEKGVRLNEEGDLVIPIYGQPFKGIIDGKKDLGGDFFHKGTVLPDVSEYATFWDHGRDKNYMRAELKSLGFSDDEIDGLNSQDFGFGRRDIAKAVRSGMDENGIIYDIIVNRRFKYLQALKKAAENGLIDGSGEYKHFEYDKDVPGKVDYAAMVGMALTPSPFNIKAHVLKGIELEKNMDEKEKGKETPASTVADAATKPPTLSEALAQKGAELDEKLSKPNVEKAASEETVTIPASEFNALKQELANQGKRIEGMEKSMTEFIGELTLALPKLGEIAGKGLILYMREQGLKSEAEVAAEGGLFKGVIQKARNVPESAGDDTVFSHSRSMANYPGSK